MIEQTHGKREELTGKELETLETKIIPTARRWLRELPFLAEHAVKTLAFWKEDIVDDYGRPYVPHDATDAQGNKRDKK